MQKIMFTEGLTRAVLEELKNMTRRIIPEKLLERAYASDDMLEYLLHHSPYKVGEVVAVAQCYEEAISPLDWVNRLIYKDEPGWKNKMYVRADLMPHQIQITGRHVERLQDISDEDCLREGVFLDEDETAPSCYQPFYTFPGSIDHDTQVGYKTPREAFAALIKKMHGRKAWDDNPWTFAYDFTRIK